MRARAARAPRKISFFFSSRGDRAAFLRGGEGQGLGVGTWAWRAGAPRYQLLSTSGESLNSRPLPLEDGRVLVLRSGAGVHQLVLLAPEREERNLGRIDSRGLHLLPSPDPGTMAVARGVSSDGNAALWLIRETGPHIEQVPRPRIRAGTLRGGHWLDDAGRTLGLDHHCCGRSRIVAVDLATGTASWLTRSTGGEEGGDSDHLLLSAPGSGRFLAARKIDGDFRLGWGSWDRGDWQLAFPEELSSFDGPVTPLAIDPAGRRVAISVEKGLRSDLYVCEPGEPGVCGPGESGPCGRRRVSIPPGVLWPAARWTPGGLHLVTSGPQRPTTVMTVTPATAGPPVATGTPGHRRRGSGRELAPPGGWAGAHAEVLAGPAGPVEAVIYGGPRWRESERLLIALHGGPHAAWKLSFEPLLQDLAAAGMAVVAPNQRGSTGYGPAHRDAIRGAWGGPDLADLRHLAESLSLYRRRRDLPAVRLYGVSYGAFLALLAAAAAPALWSRCVAVAPFCSAQSLYAEGADGVKSFLRRHGALDVIDDALGPRDLERLAERITAQVLIVHGSGDDTIPVSQPRRIVAALERAGRRSGTEFIYREVPGGHDPLQEGAADDAPRRQVIEFLAGQADADRALSGEAAGLSGRSS
jgi:pimeloyl-ACP methyl ester carboxylesterase